jgi:hypothetical protein
MKILKSFLVLIVLIAGVFVGTLFAEAGPLKLASMTGNVMVKIDPAAEWMKAEVGQTLNQKDSIKTDSDASAILEFPDKSSLSLNKNTEISIEELVWDSVQQKVGVKMTKGELRTVIDKVSKPSQFRIKTPTAICGARGTVFYVVVDGNDTRVFVTEGSIDFSNIGSGDTFVVVEGMTSLSTATGIETPRELTGDERQAVVDAWTALTSSDDTGSPDSTPGEIDNVMTNDNIPENPAQENKGQQEQEASPIQ